MPEMHKKTANSMSETIVSSHIVLKTLCLRLQSCHPNVAVRSIMSTISFVDAVLAYFDPGAGSLLVQALVGGAAGLLVFAKYLWESRRSLFARRQFSHESVKAPEPLCNSSASGRSPGCRAPN